MKPGSSTVGRSESAAPKAAPRARPADRSPSIAEPHPVLQLQRAVGNWATRRLMAPPLETERVKPGAGGAQPERAERAPDAASLLQLQRTMGNRRVAAALRSSAADPRGGRALEDRLAGHMSRLFGVDLAGVRVHAGSPIAVGPIKAVEKAGELHFRAGAYQPGTADGDWLIAHELAHVVQQRGPAGGRVGTRAEIEQEADRAASHVVRGLPARIALRAPAGEAYAFREGQAREDGGADPGREAAASRLEAPPRGGQRFSFSEDEMERRLEATPGGERGGERPRPQPETTARLDQAQHRVEEGRQQERARLRGGKRPGEGKAGSNAERVREAARPRPRRGRGGGESPGRAEPAPTPGPAGEFEGIIGNAVNAYLDGADTGAKIAPLTATTTRLLEGARGLAETRVVEPPASALGQLTGVSPLIAAFTRGSQGYEHEEPWLRVVAQIREITSSLGGVVGMIGLAATVSGAILSLLIPPVGAFLLTVGRFCDVAAIILDAVSFVLNGFLTGYNLYRLKNATDPAEKRRLLGLVRSDAMATVMSGFALATAAAPGLGRAIGRTRVGRMAGNALSRVGGRIGQGLARVPGARLVRSARNVTVGTVHRVAERLRGTSVIQGLNRRATALEGRLLGRLANRPRVLRAYQQSRGLANVIHEGSIRGYHVDFGRRMHASLDQLQRRGGLTLQQIGARLEQQFGVRFGGHQFSIIRGRSGGLQFAGASWDAAIPATVRRNMSARLRALTTGPSAITDIATLERQIAQGFGFRERRSVFFTLEQDAAGRLHFPREDASFLMRLRQTEFNEIQRIRAANSTATSAQLEGLVNSSPAIRGRYTASELDAMAAGTFTNLPKTPHHTIPAQVAPHLHQDPRFIQMVNDPRAYDAFVRSAFPGHTPVFNTADLQALLNSGGIRGIRDPGYFLGANNQAFIRELQRSGTGVWVNPFDRSQRFIFNAHGVIGHNWNYADDRIIRTVFGEFATRQGETTRRILGSGAREAARIVPPIVFQRPRPPAAAPQREQRPIEPTTADAAQLPDTGTSVEPGFRSSGSPEARTTASASVPPSGSLAFLASLRARAARGIVAFPASTAAPTAPLGPSPGGGTAPLVSPAARNVVADLPEPPPAAVDYSPRSLTEIVAEKADVAEAIAGLEALVLAAHEVQRDNSTVERRASELNDQNVARRSVIQGEKADVTQQAANLGLAGRAQQNMSEEGARVSSESRRGQDQAKAVEAQGNATTVEAKPEEPQRRSWLERAWDATAGALWDELIAPAIRFVRRKVQQVMQKINDFIMRMISQALGLDQIEAEIDAGGTDITNRQTSLNETQSGLDEAHAQTEGAEATNASTIEQARANVTDATAAEEHASRTLQALRQHHAVLSSQEVTARSYVTSFGQRYATFFDPRRASGSAAPAAEATAAAEVAPPAEARLLDPGMPTPELVTEAHVATVVSWIAAVRRGDDAALSELTQLARESGAAVVEHLRSEERASSSAALDTFQDSRRERGQRLEALLGEARRCVGLSIDAGAERLQAITDRMLDVGQEVESARVSALALIGAVHERALEPASGTAPPEAPDLPGERV